MASAVKKTRLSRESKKRLPVRSLVLSTLLALMFSGLSSAVLAWDSFGHMTVAYVCYQRLTPQAKERAIALLKLNPMYPLWDARQDFKEPIGFTEDKGAQIFMLAATWPDVIKKGHGYKADGAAYGNIPTGPEATQNIGYADHLLHKYWHFVDYPFSRDGTPLPPVPSPNAETQISVFRKVLASDAADELKSYDLCWLLHIVGDIHQPLHCTTRVTKSEPHGDNGGNDVKLTDKEGVLHKFWDDVLDSEQSPPELAKTLKKADKKLAAERDEKRWIQESFKIAKSKIYQKPIGPGTGPYSLNDKYRGMAAKLARERVELAGERLAILLNEELK